MLNNDKNPATVLYMVRYALTKNITDPITADHRGYSDYEQTFSGDGTAGQIWYLERKPVAGAKFLVYVGGVLKALTTDYTLDSSGMVITWVTTPANAVDNGLVQYTSVKPWVYDDQPQLSAGYFPRITVLDEESTNRGSGIGSYISYATGIGDYITRRLSIIVRTKKNALPLVYNGVTLKNYDLNMAISESIEAYFNANRVPRFWKFHDWKVVRSRRVFTEEENFDVLRRDITVELRYFRGNYQ